MERLGNIDRRWIWAIMFVFLAYVTVASIGLPITVNPDAQKFYNFVDGLKPGSIVILAADFGPSTQSELGPMVTAFAHHAFKKGLRIAIFTTNWQLGPQVAGNLVKAEADKLNKKYGVDWINIGFKPSGQASLLLAESDLMQAAKGTDQYGNDLSQYPIMKDLPRFDKDHVAAVFSPSAGTPGAVDFWLPYFTQKTGVALLSGAITLDVPENKPYLASGQLTAQLDGSRGAAEYESLLHYPGKATQAQDGQSLAALYITLLIILGNIAYLSARRKTA